MSYDSEVLADSPYLFWKLDDASGTTAVDSSGNGRSGTYTGTFALAAPPVVSGVACAVNLNPSTNNGYVGATLASFAPTALTVEAWIATTDSNFGLISYASSSNANEFLIQPTTASVITVYVRGTMQSFTLPFSYQNRRAHVVATWRNSDGRVQVWINGFLAGSGTAATGVTLTTGGSFMVGQDQDTLGGGGLQVADAMTARTNCVAVYTSVLSDARIAAHYVAGSYVETDVIPHVETAELSGFASNEFDFDTIEMFSAGVNPIDPLLSISPGASAVAPSATVSVSITEADPFEHVLRVRDDVTGGIELVAIGGGSVPASAALPGKYSVAVVPISGGYRYDVTAVVGWKHPFTVFVDAYSLTTGHAAANTSYTLTTSPTTATVTNFSPVSASTIAPGDSFEFDVLDDQPFDHVIYLRHEDTQETEIVAIGGGTVPAVATHAARFSVASTPIVGGYRYEVASLDGWKFPFTVFVEAYGKTINGEPEIHTQGWAYYDVSPLPVAGSVSSFSPTSGTVLAPADTFDVSIVGDAAKTLQGIFVAYGGGLVEPYELVAFGSGAPMTPVNDSIYSVAATPISGGYRYTVGKVGGWLRAFTVFVFTHDQGFVESGIDPALAFGTVDYGVAPSYPLDVATPTVSILSPVPETAITSTTPIVFDVLDDSGTFRRVLVAIYEPTLGVTRLVHDGDSFLGGFALWSSRSMIAGGFRYTVISDSGWTSSPTLRVFAIDRAGREV